MTTIAATADSRRKPIYQSLFVQVLAALLLGIAIGMAAPDFELPDLTGVRHKLSEYRNRNVLLIFFNPQCGYCTKMAPELAALPEGGGDRPAL